MVTVELCSHGELIDPDLRSRTTEAAVQAARAVYWRIITKVVSRHMPLVVRLSGLHSRIQDLVEAYSWWRVSRGNCVMHFHNWEVADGTVDKDCFSMVECTRSTLRQLYERYWFSISEERRVEVFVLKPATIQSLERWSRRAETPKKRRDLIAKCHAVIDNCHNGLHFTITLADNLSGVRDVERVIPKLSMID